MIGLGWAKAPELTVSSGDEQAAQAVAFNAQHWKMLHDSGDSLFDPVSVFAPIAHAYRAWLLYPQGLSEPSLEVSHEEIVSNSCRCLGSACRTLPFRLSHIAKLAHAYADAQEAQAGHFVIADSGIARLFHPRTNSSEPFPRGLEFGPYGVNWPGVQWKGRERELIEWER